MPAIFVPIHCENNGTLYKANIYGLYFQIYTDATLVWVLEFTGIFWVKREEQINLLLSLLYLTIPIG